MSYQVTARKWRPQTFSGVVYQDHVTRTLTNSIESGRISHAYLFAGPRGTGKTTMARILAKALNCETGLTPKPCLKCGNCTEIRSGISFDVIEIDGASNRGIEDIRVLRENVNFAPVKARYKIYIIDEVHMLTKEAFNALLKTIEEPPPHVIFIFATTEVHQIPETILSRCQKFFFKKIPVRAIVEQLKGIVKKEGFTVSESALYSLARVAGGSMRDAQSFLDQVISFSEKEGKDGKAETGEFDALSILGIMPLESYIRQLGNIAAADAASAIHEAAAIFDAGADLARYVSGFMDAVRTIRILKNGVSVKELFGLSDDEAKLLKDCAGLFCDEELGSVFHIANDLARDLRFSGDERINLEMAFLDMIAVKKTPSLSSIIEKLDKSSFIPESGGGGAQEKKPAGEKKRHAGKPPAGAAPATPPAHKELLGMWAGFMGDISISKPYLSFILKPATVEWRDNILTIVYPGNIDHSYYGKILDAKNQAFIQDELSRMAGVKLAVKVGFSDEKIAARPAGVRKEPAVMVENGDEAPPPEEEMLRSPEDVDFSSSDPAVDRIRNAFHGEIIEKNGGKQG